MSDPKTLTECNEKFADIAQQTSDDQEQLDRWVEDGNTLAGSDVQELWGLLETLHSDAEAVREKIDAIVG